MSFTLEDAQRTINCDATVDELDTGAGVSRVDICDGALVLSSHALTVPAAFGAAAVGVATANIIANAVAGNAGVADNCKWYNRTPALRFTGTVTMGGGGGDIDLTNTAIAAGITVRIEGGAGGGTITQDAT